MRNTIYTSVAAIFLATLPSAAQDCFARDYSAEHLSDHPKQVVASLVMRFQLNRGSTLVHMAAQIADNGHAKGTKLAGQWLDQGLYCFEGYGTTVGTRCGVDCDGGTFEITNVQGDNLTFRTDYLTIGDTEGCGGSTNLAEEQGKPVSYRVTRAPNHICEAHLK